MKVDVIGSNSPLFANLPPASQVPGRTYRVSNVGPAPGILLTSDGTKYRPAGGRQVLAMRANNPVTMQSISLAVADTIGPFPGGLVRAGMRLEITTTAKLGALTTSSRKIRVLIGSPSSQTTHIGFLGLSDNNINSNVAFKSWVNILSDTLGTQLSTPSNGVDSAALTFGYRSTVAQESQIIDFSSAWAIALKTESANETAVNISSATWAGGIATFNTSAAHTLAVGDKTVIAGVTPSGWNIPAGAIVLSVPTTTQFTVALAADPGTYSTGGTSSRISNIVLQSYVLELIG